MAAAGKRRNLVKLQKEVVTKDSYGDNPVTYLTIMPAWASIRPLGGRELINAQQVSSEVSHEITTFYNEEITARGRVLFNDQVFHIESKTNPDQRKKDMVLMCKEIV